MKLTAKEAGKQIGEAINLIDFSLSENNFTALAKLPYILFAEYIPDPDKMYYRGEVIRVKDNKYLIQNQGRIENDRPPHINSLCKLFRDSKRYDFDGNVRFWVREEWCLFGYERYYENPDRPQDNGWYRVKTNHAEGNNTQPPGMPNIWERCAN